MISLSSSGRRLGLIALIGLLALLIVPAALAGNGNGKGGGSAPAFVGNYVIGLAVDLPGSAGNPQGRESAGARAKRRWASRLEHP
jgi:hypothetical protein